MQKILRYRTSVNHYVISITTGLLILFLTIGLFTPAIIQAQKDRPGKALTPSLILVPNGMAVTTSTGTDGPTVRVIDISHFGALWVNPANRSPYIIHTPGEMPMIQTWTPADFTDSGGGQSMRGLAVSADGTKIWAGTSPFVLASNLTPNIWRIGPSSATPVLLSTLPSYTPDVSMRRAVAGIDVNEAHNMLYAANYADGIIYRIDAATPGPPIDSFDPLLPYAGGATNTLPLYGDRVVAVAYNKTENRLYYGIWKFIWFPFTSGSGPNSVRSVGLTAAGGFDPSSDRLEFNLPESVAPVADIEFNNAGNKMLLAEEVLATNPMGAVDNSAHSARGLEYAGGTGAWTLDMTNYAGSGVKYNIGASFGRRNCRGGVAWAYTNITAGVINGNENFVMFTGDALQNNIGGDGSLVYGLQYTPSTGGAASNGSTTGNSLIADLDYEIMNSDKYIYGDVDIRRNLIATAAMVSVSGRVLGSSGNGLSGTYVYLTDVDGNTRTALTNAFGYYGFDNVLAGRNYVISPSSKQHNFESQLITALEEMTDVNFTEL
jgi:hypothetical protein